MLRDLYRFVVLAHPARFRRRFGDEMLSIFDQSEGKLSRVRLLADGVMSLLRQWALRPEVLQETAVSTVAGQPHFYTFEREKLRAATLVYGALLSALVLNGVCWTMGYAWNHPIFMDIRPGYGPRGRVPESKLVARPVHRSPIIMEPPLYTQEGRLVLVFNAPRRSTSNHSRENSPRK
jgi:hypothetical protein